MELKITIIEDDEAWHVSMVEGESIYPTTSYPTSRLAVARVLQLLDLGPVGPQDHPEDIEIKLEE